MSYQRLPAGIERVWIDITARIRHEKRWYPSKCSSLRFMLMQKGLDATRMVQPHVVTAQQRSNRHEKMGSRKCSSRALDAGKLAGDKKTRARQDITLSSELE